MRTSQTGSWMRGVGGAPSGVAGAEAGTVGATGPLRGAAGLRTSTTGPAFAFVPGADPFRAAATTLQPPTDFKGPGPRRGVDAEAAYRSIREIAAEAVSEEELKALCAKAAQGGKPRAYIGFEPSGTAHVGWMVCTDTVRRLTAAGFDVTILLADWHAQINDKLDGDLEAIQRCGKYMEEAFETLGVLRATVTYRYANDFASDPTYWAMVIKVAKHASLARMRRAMTIMGRSEDEADGDISKFIYPAMQVADIFHMKVELAYGGLDQRHAHMLARDIAPKLGLKAPTALHTPLVPSLKGAGRMDASGQPTGGADKEVYEAMLREEILRGRAQPEAVVEARRRLAERNVVEKKMSKSDPDSGIFIHDSAEDIKRKLKAAHCPAKEIEGNPVLDLLRLVIWPRLAELHKDGPPRFEIHRPEKFGGNKLYIGYEAVLKEYKSGALHPLDLKMGIADALTLLLEPVRKYFKYNPANLHFVESLKRTR